MADINVLMMGGRRAGKTSVLASMDECCKNVLASEELLKLVTNEGSITLSNKKTELSDYFTDPRYLKSMKFEPDLNPSDAETVFEYECLVGGKGAGYTLRFQDVPGEWYEDPEYEADVKKRMKDSHIFLIAIDSPHMMECISEAEKLDGYCRYHEEYNRVSEITNFFKTAFQNSGNSRNEKKLVIFVPLKCEKYYYRNEMKKLYDTIRKGYGDLLRVLASPGICEICTVAVMPILTLGGAEFFKFSKGTYVGEYNYVEDKALREYQPKYCEQPLLLSLKYVVSLARAQSEGKLPPLRLFSEIFGNRAKLDALKECESAIRHKIMTDSEKGFGLLQDPDRILEINRVRERMRLPWQRRRLG